MKMPENNLQALVTYFKDQLLDFYESNEIKAMLPIVFNHYFGLNKADLVLEKHRRFSESELLKIINTVKSLKNHKPLAYILGEWEFYGLRLKVDESTLIPRPETEELVNLIVTENQNANTILDIGTGSGCIALALKSELKNTTVTAWDVSEKALKKVAENSLLNQLKINIEQVDILADKNSVLHNKIDVIVSNPPYIPTKEKQLMEKNVLDYEPHLALFVDDKNPLLFYKTIVDFALLNLTASGKLYFEINEKYGDEIVDLLEEKKMKNVMLIKDINGKARIVKCTK
jgi:release factor glutamine methyltransferase